MSEIGNILKEARESRGLTMDEVYQSLRIQPKYLSALESGEYQIFPSSTHVRGYLRKYARHLSLDPDPMLERLDYSRVGAWNEDPTIPLPPIVDTATTPVLPVQPETGTFFAPLNTELKPDAEDADWIGRLIIIALVIAIAMVTWRLLPFVFGDQFGNVGSNNPELQAAVQELLGSDEAATAGEPEATSAVITSELIVPTGRTAGGTSGAGDTAATASDVEVSPTRNPLPATLNEINMVVEIVQNQTWLRVTVDDQILFEGQAEKGEVQEYSTGGKVNIRTGNGAGVIVRINDTDLGRLGERSEVVDRTWETTQ